MDTKHRDRYRITKTQPHGKSEKKRPQASVNANDAQHQPQAPSPNDKPPSEASQGDDAPLQGDATQHDNPQRDTSQDDPSASYWRPPVASYNLLRILPAVEISSDPKLLIRNPRAEGPQTDICAQVPGTFKHWAARVSCYDSLYDLYDWILGNSGEEHPEIWMYVSTVPHGFVDFYQMDLLSLVEPLSIIAIATRGHPQGSGLTEAESGSVPAFPLLPGLRELLGPEGSEWLV
ncbi:hypothetical protein FANTH_10341 [Fusarium anthophilum]|uniref:Uncharacterized protein n=1 Tax=Fusarium anthophilum TaxID=48485 RepID=A0A8H5DWF4_9HYPO|nr:hypothetical protein FANTH_10341 [Fusarium anthophilum]